MYHCRSSRVRVNALRRADLLGTLHGAHGQYFYGS